MKIDYLKDVRQEENTETNLIETANGDVKCLRIIQLTGSTVTKYQVKKQQGIP
jgi:hypothetical protein